jgi:hypothetical protein
LKPPTGDRRHMDDEVAQRLAAIHTHLRSVFVVLGLLAGVALTRLLFGAADTMSLLPAVLFGGVVLVLAFVAGTASGT